MSREGRSARGGGREGVGGVAPQSYPTHFYPMVGYQGPPPPQPWFPGHPAPGVPTPWAPSWSPPMGYPAPTPAWSTQQTASTATTTSSTAPIPSDEYTVDTLRRVYKDDDGRVEIQRVKVQRRHPETGALTLPTGPEAMSVVPVGNIVNERRPPPRKNRRKQQVQIVTPGGPGQAPGPYPWYPYMPYMPYPYPYPYYLGGCMWPPGVPAASVASWSGNEESERASSRQDSLPATLDSQRLESRISPPSHGSIITHRTPSPAATLHGTDTHSIAPSDSVSVRGRKRETSLERALRGPTPPPRTKSRASSDFKSSDVGKTQEWMLEMQQALGATAGDAASDLTDKSSIASGPSDVVIYKKIPPKRKRRKVKIGSVSDKDSVIDPKDIDSISDRQSVVSDMTFDESSRLSSELNYAFRKLERSVDAFKTKVSVESTPVQSPLPSPSIEFIHSSGNVTPTEGDAIGPPVSDIALPLEEASKLSPDEQDQIEASFKSLDRAISPCSVSSLPSLVTAKTGSVVDVSIPQVVIELPAPDASHPVADLPAKPQTEATPPRPATTTSDAGIATTPPSALETSPPHLMTNTSTTQAPLGTSAAQTTVDVGPQPANVITSQSASASVEVTTPASASTSDIVVPAAPEEETPQRPPQSGAVSSQPMTVSSPSQPVTVSSPSSDEPAPVPVSGSADQAVSREAPGGAGGEGEALSDASGRDSRASSSAFFSMRPSDDPVIDTDSTDIPLPTTADEGGEHTDSPAVSSGPEERYQWVLQQPGETPDLATSNSVSGEDDRRNAWRAEVSLWRARLVVSLCRGRGLDRQDWATFHLLVHHPLTLDLKLSLLHAQRFCAANTAAGVALVRVGLIHLAQYGETLLQAEESRQPNWRTIKVEPNQPWTPVKGSIEILRSLGYREREDGGVLKYPRRSGPEVSVLARLTLDMLVLAEELRLYLTGTHQYPANISDLFFPASGSTTASPTDPPQRPPSSAGSFVSAQSEAPFNLRPESRASSVTDDDTETLQASVRQVKTQTKKAQRSSSSEEEVTLKDDTVNKVPAKAQAAEVTVDIQEVVPPPPPPSGLDTLPVDKEEQQLGSTASLPTSPGDRSSVSTNMTSLPDLQSIRSSSASQQSSAASGSTDTVTPTVTPAPAPPTASSDNPEDHIYEEIDVIRAQNQAVRASSVPIESAPPPLPPKKKVSSGGEDDSGLSLTYPQVEWISASTPGSLRGGSTGARRKKRRAPMPPEFMPPDWKEYQNKPQESPEQTSEPRDVKDEERKRAEYLRSLNPFYEEPHPVQEKAEEPNDAAGKSEHESVSNGNPFIEDSVKVAGYVGKNPFYEDVELLQKPTDSKETSASHPSLPSLKLDGSVCGMGSLPELQDNSVAVRPKRRAPKPPPPPQLTAHTSTPELPKHSTTPQTTEPAGKPKRPPTPEILKQASSATPSASSTTPTASSSATPTPLPEDKTQHTENVKQEVIANDSTLRVDKISPQIQSKGDTKDTSQASSQDAAKPGENDLRVTSVSGNEKAVGAQQNGEVTAGLSSTYETDLRTDDGEKRIKADVPSPPNSDQRDLTAENHQLKNMQLEREGNISPIRSGNSKEKTKEPGVPDVNKDDTEVSKTGGEVRQMTPKLSRAAQQRMSPPHPKTPPPPPPKTEIGVTKATPVGTPTAETPPPVLPPKAPLSILDDIPYMDANEVRYARAKHLMQKIPLPTQNETPEAPSASPSTMRQTASLRRGTHIASVTDDSDLPPDCPPPPPPGPPPESPPSSPPETPHTSPPETPHTSPPETPHSSPRSSPITVAPLAPAATTDAKAEQDSVACKAEGNDGDVKDVAPPIPPKATHLMTLAQIEAPQSASTSAPSTSGKSTATQPKPSASPETVQPPPLLPPKATLKSLTPVPSDASTSYTHEPASGKHSLQSSVSEERYEIPDTSLAPPPRPPPPPLPASKKQAKEKTAEPYTAPSEADRYEVPEPPKDAVRTPEALKTPTAAEVEERYEIPEVVKETALKTGANGAPLTVVMGRTASMKRRELEAIFGPPKPPRRRRSHPPPPPRPPKSVTLMDGTKSLTKAGAAVRPPSATSSSFSTTSGGTTSSVPSAPPPTQCKQKRSKLRRSWPFLFCDCMYVNCRNYDDANKK